MPQPNDPLCIRSQLFTPESRLLSTLGLPSRLATALEMAGYEVLSDIADVTEHDLLQELGLVEPLPPILLPHLLSEPSGESTIPLNPTFSVSQLLSLQEISSAESMNTLQPAIISRPYTTPSDAINALLSQGARPLKLKDIQSLETRERGLSPHSILEISGPPGSGKGSLALEFIRSAIRKNQEVLVADTRSTLTPCRLRHALEELRTVPRERSSRTPLECIYHARIDDHASLVAFLYRLHSYLESNPKVALLVFSTVSAVLYGGETSHKNRIIDLLKNALPKACMQHGITIIVTSPTATKLVGPDGSHATFDTGSRAIMVPQLGTGIFTASRSYRLMLFKDAAGLRHARLHAAPAIRKQVGNPPSDHTLTVAFRINDSGRICDHFQAK